MSRADGARATGGGVGANGASLAATPPYRRSARSTRPPLTTLTAPVSVPVSGYHNPYYPGTGIRFGFMLLAFPS